MRLACHKRVKNQRRGYSYSSFYGLSGNWILVPRTCEALNSDVCLCLVWRRSCLYFMCFKSGSFWCPHHVCMFQSNTASLFVSLIQPTKPHFLHNITGLNVRVICLKVLRPRGDNEVKPGYNDIGLYDISSKAWYQFISLNRNIIFFGYNNTRL
jgi:hypothetical protein